MISLNYDLSQGIILSRAFSSHSSLQSVEHELEYLRQYLDSQNWCAIDDSLFLPELQSYNLSAVLDIFSHALSSLVNLLAQNKLFTHEKISCNDNQYTLYNPQLRKSITGKFDL